jgi:hypothetical protein
MGSGAKPYMRNGFLIYEEIRKYFTIYEAVSQIQYDFAPDPSKFPYMRGTFSFLFFSVVFGNLTRDGGVGGGG